MKCSVNFGENMKQLRMMHGMTQQRLADRLGVTKSVISYYENGTRNASAPIIIHCAEIFHVTTDWLLGITSKSDIIDISTLSKEQKSIIHQLVDVFVLDQVQKNLQQ